jgi:hypothetical protein
LLNPNISAGFSLALASPLMLTNATAQNKFANPIMIYSAEITSIFPAFYILKRHWIGECPMCFGSGVALRCLFRLPLLNLSAYTLFFVYTYVILESAISMMLQYVNDDNPKPKYQPTHLFISNVATMLLQTVFLYLAVIASVLAQVPRWGPHVQLGPTSNEIIRIETTFTPGTLQKKPDNPLYLWPGISNAAERGGDLI